MSVFCVKPSQIKGEIELPYSKSHLIRLIALACFCDNQTTIKGYSSCDDTDAFLDFAKAFADISRQKDTLIVLPKPSKGVAEYSGEGAFGYNLASAICAAKGVSLFVNPIGRLAKRQSSLQQLLQQNGITYKGNLQSGKLTSGTFVLDCTQSSQPLSAALIAFPLLNRDISLLVGNTVSFGYVNLTLQTMRAFGGIVQKTGQGFATKGIKQYHSPVVAEAEKDASAAALMLAVGALLGEVRVRINPQTYQTDISMVTLLKNMGADIEIKNNVIISKKSKLAPFVLDADLAPDLVPIAAVLAANANGRSKILHSARLATKESDRFMGTADMLNSFGITATAENDTITILGGKPKGTTIRLDDHRMEYAATLLALCADEDSIIEASGYTKSYPAFFEDIKRCGAEVYEISR